MEKENSEKKQWTKEEIIKEVLSWIVILVAAFVVGHILNHHVIMKAQVPSGSMKNTIMDGDRLIGNRIAYLFLEPKRGDVVMFPYPDNENELYVKRIIGLPGETIEIIDGKVYIDGSTEPLEESYLPDEMIGSYGPYEVPEGCYFMMGDNRNISRDARDWNNKFVEKDDIVAKVVFRYAPNFSFIK